MSSRGKTTFLASVVLVISMAASILLLYHIDEIRPRATIEDALYINSPKVIKRASLGFDGLMACVYWTRTVQYFGHRHFLREHSYNELAPLLEITTALDPHLIPAYQLGASFLAPRPPNGAGQPERAVELMRFGIQNNSDNWNLYYNLGFIYYTELKDYAKAAEAFAQGSKVPNAHPFLKILAARMAEHAEEYSTARILWTATYESSKENEIRENAAEHLRSLKVDEDVTQLQAAVDRFAQNSGRPPVNLWEVVAAEHLAGIPLDPDGNPYELGANGQVRVQEPDDFPFLTKGVPPDYKPGPPKFHTQH